MNRTKSAHVFAAALLAASSSAQVGVIAMSPLLAPAPAQAKEPTMAMHDHAAMERLGSVSFATSCTASVRPLFDRAVALMHSFQFGSAIDGFNAVLAADPKCAIAYWGIALSNWSNPFAGFKSPAQLAKGLKAVEQGRALGTGTKRERAYLDAVANLYVDVDKWDQDARLNAYEGAMERVAADYPDDIEARIFYALALAAAADPADKSYARQIRAGAILETLFARYPDHPGLAHYIIHAYDEPALAPRAAEAARRYSTIAPSTPHALHMPSHTFTRLGDWQASISTNLASAAAARAAGQPADELHASDYMVCAYLQTGQDRAAERLVATSAEVFARFDPAHANGAAPASAAYFAHAAIPARYALERHAWAEAAALQPLATRFPYADAITYFARGLGAAHLRDTAGARAAIASLDHIHEKLTGMGEDYWANQIDIQRREVAATLAYTMGNVSEALAGLQAAAALEGKSELASVTPGPLQPASEMLGEIFLDQKRPVDALKAFEASLMQQPNRFWSLYGAARAAKFAGDAEIAGRFQRELSAITVKADQPGRREIAETRRDAAT